MTNLNIDFMTYKFTLITEVIFYRLGENRKSHKKFFFPFLSVVRHLVL